MQVDDSWNSKSSKCRSQVREKEKRWHTSHFSSLRHICTNIIPKISLWKLLLVIHLFIVLSQINRCESSAKWWSIASIPTSPGSQFYVRRLHRHHSKTAAGHRSKTSQQLMRNTNSKNSEDFLPNDKIKEILTNSEINKPTSTEGQGSFINQNKRHVTNKHADITRTNKIYTKLLSANLKPPALVDQREQLLTRKQRRMLRKNAGSLEEIIMGLKKAVKECKHQFRNRRWVCQTDPRDSSLFGKIVNRGFRETAFIYAITSAAVSHAIAHGCSQGTIAGCGCANKQGQGGPGWEWAGCSDNFKFAKKFARDFVDAGEIGNDLKYRMNLHNNQVGRQTVEGEKKKFCRCHGMSGSCTSKTCWLRVPNFRVIASRLRDKFDDAERVTISNNGKLGKRDSGLVPAIHGRKSPKKGDLVYFENSPSFCVGDPEFWSAGTRGRTCNGTSNGLNGCDSICCGRGFRTRIKTVKQNCQCEFEWCCKVKCQICEVEKEISTCK